MNGKVLGGRYRLEEKIGVGGMAEVYRAYDTILNRTVAVKILHPQYAGEENFVARFRREAQAAANLNQPNIVEIYDWGSENGTSYLVMECLVGKTLKTILAEKGKLAPQTAIDIGRQVAAALQVAHRNNIVHRDIKPHNIIVTDEGGVKVMDFGIARSTVSGDTQTGTILGTAHYLSPEQARGQDVGTPSDLYSLGVVLYQMLAGEVPFDGESPVAIVLKHVQEEPRPLREINPDVSPALAAVVHKALAKEPSDRYLSAAELRNDLGRAAEGLGPAQNNLAESEKTVVLSKPALPPAAGRGQRRPWKTAGLVFLFILLFAGSAFGTRMFLGRVAPVEVPDIKGKTVDEAKDILKKGRLKLKVNTEEFSDKVAAGLIISQQPEAGGRLRPESPVLVRVSKGKKLIEMPDLANKILSQATFILAQQGLNVGDIRHEYSDTISEDYVILQEPPAEQKVSKGTSVNLVISKGPRPLKAPDLIGKTVAEAQALLASIGLVIDKEEDYSDTVEAGRIISQSPDDGVPIERGESVKVVVSKGPLMVKVPAVKGLTEAEAKAQLEGAGFVVQIKDGVSASESYGKVVTQNPEADTSVRKGSTVTIWVGREPDADATD